MIVRKMEAEDAGQVAELSGELGYPVAREEMRSRIQELAASPSHANFVACDGSGVIGWIDVAIVRHLASMPFGEIGGLIVSDAHRSHGIGQLLVEHAEQWIASCGIRKVVVRSRTSRERAHHFYLKQGYAEWKRQAVFSKEF